MGKVMSAEIEAIQSAIHERLIGRGITLLHKSIVEDEYSIEWWAGIGTQIEEFHSLSIWEDGIDSHYGSYLNGSRVVEEIYPTLQAVKDRWIR